MSNTVMRQIWTITTMSIRNMSARVDSSIVSLVGIAGVVTVLVGVLSIGEGFRAVLDESGAPDVAIVLRDGATDELGSDLSLEQTRVIMDNKQIAADSAGPIASSELYVVVDVPMKSTGTVANVPLRGVGPQATKLRQKFKIVQGRNFQPGTFEVIAGRGASLQFSGLTVGNTVRWGATDWTVTGIFEDGGSVSESEIWTNDGVLQNAYNRGSTYQSLRAKLTSAAAAEAFKDALTRDPRLSVRVYTERQYYVEQSRSLVTLVSTIGAVIAILMGLGAVVAALNTMYSAVSSRVREIATLRAMGFGTAPVIASVLAEGVLIGLLGGTIGAIVAYLAFNGVRASTINLASLSQVSFAFMVTPPLLVQAIVYALLLGFIGGLLPSLRAARLPIATGLREL